MKDVNIQSKEAPILFINKNNCCGCSACYVICPVKAITMAPDLEGFLYPQVNEDLCVRCYQCIRVCAFKTDQADKGYYNQ